MSLVARCTRRTLRAFPRFRDALAAAVSANWRPGMRSSSRHCGGTHVESLEPFNLLVNYWWHASGGAQIGGPAALTP